MDGIVDSSRVLTGGSRSAWCAADIGCWSWAGQVRPRLLTPPHSTMTLTRPGPGQGGPDFASPGHSFSFPSLFSSSHLLRVAPAPPLSSFLRHLRPGHLAATLRCAALRCSALRYDCKSPNGVAQRHLILRCGALRCTAALCPCLAGWLRAIQRDARQGNARHHALPCGYRIPCSGPLAPLCLLEPRSKVVLTSGATPIASGCHASRGEPGRGQRSLLTGT